MIGLEYILALYNIPHTKLAEELGIARQNINLWIKGKGKISEKYLEVLSEKFGVDKSYISKELNDIDKLIIQKEKLKKELSPEIIGYNTQLTIGNNADLVYEPIYNTSVINEIEIEIKKTKAIEDFRTALSCINKDYDIQMFEQITMLLNERVNEKILRYTIDAISHYYNVLPDWVGEPESDEFVQEFINLAERYDDDII